VVGLKREENGILVKLTALPSIEADEKECQKRRVHLLRVELDLKKLGGAMYVKGLNKERVERR